MDIIPILDRYSRAAARQSGYWLKLWKEARHYSYPNEESDTTEGGQRGTDLFNTIGADSRYRLAAGMFAWMAPPEQKWFDLRPADRRLADDDDVKIFFSKLTDLVSEAMANSNWASILIQALNELACGMDAVIYCEDAGGENDDSPVSFRRYRVEDVCYCENSRGIVDTIFIKRKWTARQLLADFGDDKLPEKILADARNPRSMENEYQILHAVFPRKDRDPSLRDNRNMPVADLYIDLDSKTVIEESGFQEFPFSVCRFEKSADESYGRGPGINALPTIKMINRYAQADIVGTEHLADPSYIAPDGSIVSKEFNRDPGSVTFYKPGLNGERIEQLPNHYNPSLTMQQIQLLETKIKAAFFLDIFDPLGDLKNITATEAEIRNESKIVPFAPIVGNIHTELFRPIIHRVLNILARHGKMPELPEKLAGTEYRVEFVSKIARALRKQKVLAWMQTEASITNLVPAAPDVIDNFAVDKIARDIAIINGAEPEWLRPVREVEDIRELRREAQQRQQAADQLLAGAGALGNNMGKAPEPGSPLALAMQPEV